MKKLIIDDVAGYMYLTDFNMESLWLVFENNAKDILGDLSIFNSVDKAFSYALKALRSSSHDFIYCFEFREMPDCHQYYRLLKIHYVPGSNILLADAFKMNSNKLQRYLNSDVAFTKMRRERFRAFRPEYESPEN